MSSKVNKGVEIDLGLRASASWVLAMGTVIITGICGLYHAEIQVQLSQSLIVSLANNQ